VSDDGKNAIVLILFVGSVFSPYYAWKKWQTPDDHCALNVALYGSSPRWSMTERRATDTARTPGAFQIGKSRVIATGNGLQFDIEEHGAPLPRPLRGQVKVTAPYLNTNAYQLDQKAEHHWRPMCTHLDVEVRFDDPKLSWRGAGYLDMNFGDQPIQKGFDYWDWSRVPLTDGSTQIRYVTDPVGGPQKAIHLSIADNGKITPAENAETISMPTTRVWRIKRRTGSITGQHPRIIETMEDTPFYSRSLIDYGNIASGPGTHESLSCKRLRSPIVKAMLPFRMPRLSL
jgi:carotenoid 1,2-hydratase